MVFQRPIVRVLLDLQDFKVQKFHYYYYYYLREKGGKLSVSFIFCIENDLS